MLPKKSIAQKNLQKKGYQIVKIPKKIKNIFLRSITSMMNEKFNLNIKKIKLNKNFKLINKKINKLSDEEFLLLFGDVTNRIIPHKSSKAINSWINHSIKKVLNKNKASMHYLKKSDYVKNNQFKINQYYTYFRCVRSNKIRDVGLIHRDCDFWELADEPKLPFKYKERWKLWVPIYGCNAQNSLRLYDRSHLIKNLKISRIKKNGKIKPFISPEHINNFKRKIVQPFSNFNKEAVLFHDKIAHFGPINKNKNIRISAECNIICK